VTQEVHGAAGALMAGEVPAAWDAAWEGPPGGALPWLRGLARRAAALEDWGPGPA